LRGGLLLAITLLLTTPAGAAEAPRDSLPSWPGQGRVVGTNDIAKALIASGGVALVTLLDANVSREAIESDSRFARGVASGAEKLGNPLYIAPVLGATWLAGRATGHPGVSRSALRIAGGIAASAAVSSTVKLVAGRSRPSESPGDPNAFNSFSGHMAFPSGHTTVAFALASGIDQETSAHWVPYVVYPLAGLVGWSRMRDNRHWASDVLTGALIGTWTTHKFQAAVRSGEREPRFSFDVVPAPDAPGVGATATVRF
jgi:membrane-associated phospholipid phosphatase